jgi:hypothetical protein
VTVAEYLSAQDTQDGVLVTVTTECCEDKGGLPLWPLFFAGVVPLFFIHGNETPPLVLVVPPPPVTPPPPAPTPVPEPASLALGLIGLLGFVALRKGRKAMKALLMLLLLTVSVDAKPKTGTVKIILNYPMTVTINKGSATVEAAEYKLPPGEYQVQVLLPNGNVYTRTLTVKANCVVALDLAYTPPATVEVEVPVERIVTKEVVKESESKPEVTPYQFDVCCNCKRDDLKARLDNFAIELNRAPTSRGIIHAGNNFALDYLINTRGIDRSRLTLQSGTGPCVEMWIQP